MYNIQKMDIIDRKELTIDIDFCYDKFVGVVMKPPFFIEVK